MNTLMFVGSGTTFKSFIDANNDVFVSFDSGRDMVQVNSLDEVIPNTKETQLIAGNTGGVETGSFEGYFVKTNDPCYMTDITPFTTTSDYVSVIDADYIVDDGNGGHYVKEVGFFGTVPHR